MFSVQPGITFTVFLLEILCSFSDLGKCLLSKKRKNLAIFDLIFLLYRGLNQMIRRDLLLVCALSVGIFLNFKLILNPLYLKSFSYFRSCELSAVSFDEVFSSLSSLVFRTWVIIWGRRFDAVLIYRRLLLGIHMEIWICLYIKH